MQGRELFTDDQIPGQGEVRIALPGKAGDEVGGDEGIVLDFSQPCEDSFQFSDGVLALHPAQDPVTAALDGDVEVRLHPMVLEHRKEAGVDMVGLH